VISKDKRGVPGDIKKHRKGVVLRKCRKEMVQKRKDNEGIQIQARNVKTKDKTITKSNNTSRQV